MAGMRINRIEFVDAGFKALLNSEEVEQLLAEKANQIAAAAGEGFEAHTVKAGTRWIAFVGTTDDESVRAESEDKALSRAVEL